MKVTSDDGLVFTITAESDADLQLLGAIDMVRHIEPMQRITTAQEAGGWLITGYKLSLDPRGNGKLIADASRQALRCLGDLFRLGLREAADHGHVRPNPANPQAQETLSTGLVELQAVTQAIGALVGQLESVLQEVVRPHLVSPDASLLAQRNRV